MLTQKRLTVKVHEIEVVPQFGISDSHLDDVIPNGAAFQAQ
jgi:hypothetical protein